MRQNLIIENSVRKTAKQVISEMIKKRFTVHFMLGLPGSGKSTFIQNNLSGLPVISRDNIRIKLGLCSEGEKTVGTREEENHITEIEYDEIKNCCEKQQDFVIDDTNLNSKYRKTMINFIRSFPNSHIVVHHLNTPLEVCIDRRKDDIPPDVMRRIFDRMSIPNEDEYDDFDTVNYLNEQILYHCTPDDGKMKDRNGIWLSDEPETDYYGKYAYCFDVEGLNIASQKKTVEYIKRYDICDFKDACDCMLLDGMLDDLCDAVESGEITPEEAYDEIYDSDFQELMTEPHNYNFAVYLKDDGYDGYTFRYDDSEYYYIFYPEKCKFLGKYNDVG